MFITCISDEEIGVRHLNLTVDRPIVPIPLPLTSMLSAPDHTELCRFNISFIYDLNKFYSVWDVYANNCWGTVIPKRGISIRKSDRVAKAIIRLRCKDLLFPDTAREVVIHLGLNSNIPWCASDLNKKYSVLDYRKRLALQSKKWFPNLSTFSYQDPTKLHIETVKKNQ